MLVTGLTGMDGAAASAATETSVIPVEFDNGAGATRAEECGAGTRIASKAGPNPFQSNGLSISADVVCFNCGAGDNEVFEERIAEGQLQNMTVVPVIREHAVADEVVNIDVAQLLSDGTMFLAV